MSGLQQSAEAFAAGRRVEGLETLLAAWRETRSTELADLIDVATAELERRLGALAGNTSAQLHATWLDTATRRRSWDVSRLMRALTTQPWTWIGARIERLAAFEDDPRISRGLAQALDALETPMLVFRQTFELLGRQRDARIREWLRRRREADEPRSTVARVLHRGLDAAFEQLPPPQVLPAADVVMLVRIRRDLERLAQGPAATMAGLEAELATWRPNAVSRGGALLDAVSADPSSLLARQVYADWLTEQGDPRGELIALQCGPPTPETRRRARALFTAHGQAWLGRIQPVLRKPGVDDFERGFLATARTSFLTHQQVEALAAEQQWDTVRRLHEQSPLGPQSRFLLKCRLGALEELAEPVRCRLAADMGARAEPYARLSSLTLDVTRSRPDERRRLAAAHAFVALSRLDLISAGTRSDTFTPALEILQAPWAQRLATVNIVAREHDPIDERQQQRWRELASRLSALHTFTVHGQPRLSFEYRKGGLHLSVENAA